MRADGLVKHLEGYAVSVSVSPDLGGYFHKLLSSSVSARVANYRGGGTGPATTVGIDTAVSSGGIGSASPRDGAHGVR